VETYFFVNIQLIQLKYVHHFVLKTHNSVLFACHQFWLSLDICFARNYNFTFYFSM